jgi:hypothetical protein
VALAADQARTKFAELANVRAFGGIANDLAQVRAGVTLFGRSFATVTPVIDKVRAKMVELAAAGRAGTEEFQELNATLQSLEAEQEIEIAVDLDQAKADVEALRSDIESGETQWRISLDRSALERDLEAARTRAASLLEGTPARVQADLDIAQLEADIAALPDPIARRTLELEPEVDTPALNAITGFKEFGTAASPAEILQLGNTFQQAVLDAIRSGDQERLRLLQQQGQEFLKSFEGSIRSLAQGFPLTGFDRPSQEGVQGVTAIRDALNALQGLVSPFSLGGAPFATDFSTALRGLQAEQAQAAGSSSRTADGVETTNSLLGTANDIAAAQLGATQNLQTVITGTQATQRALLDQQRAVRDTTGNRSFVSE